MDNNENVFGVDKKMLAMRLYSALIDEDAISLEKYGAECFSERFCETLKDYSLFLKSSVIE